MKRLKPTEHPVHPTVQTSDVPATVLSPEVREAVRRSVRRRAVEPMAAERRPV